MKIFCITLLLQITQFVPYFGYSSEIISMTLTISATLSVNVSSVDQGKASSPKQKMIRNAGWTFVVLCKFKQFLLLGYSIEQIKHLLWLCKLIYDSFFI